MDNIPAINKAASDFLLDQYSIDTQLTNGLLSEVNHNQSESFKLGMIAGLTEARRIVKFLTDRPDLKED